MKQEALAQALGTNQQAISIMENSETIDEAKLIAVAEALGVTPEAIKNFSEESAINYFNNIHDNDFTNSNGVLAQSQSCNFNPLDKMMDVIEENKKLYERLLQSEKEKIAYLEKLIK